MINISQRWHRYATVTGVLLTYSGVDDLIRLIQKFGQCCLLFKCDLQKAYQQTLVHPNYMHQLGYTWQNHISVDWVLLLGLCSAAFICQHVTNAITFLVYKRGVPVANYLDVFVGAHKEARAQQAYQYLGNLLQELGLKECCLPSLCMAFLGVWFRTDTMTLEITPDQLTEIARMFRLAQPMG